MPIPRLPHRRPRPADALAASTASGGAGGGSVVGDTRRSGDGGTGERLRGRASGLVDRTRRAVLARPEVLGLVVLALVLNLVSLSQNGYANTYYSAAVRSMTGSWHDFLFNSFDPAGVMTVDKPPLALWVQALSARIFGFGSLSILVPQALMGAVTVALAYDAVRRPFGRVAGATAGLVLALTPIAVAVSRHNNPDALLVLCSTAAVWFVVRGLEDGRTRWIVLAGAAVGLGFETKMGAALLVLPAIVAAWIWVANGGYVRAIRQTVGMAVAFVVVGGAWPLLVALVPADRRPWVSGTADNSIWSLITNYNGLGRLDGQSGGPGGMGAGTASAAGGAARRLQNGGGAFPGGFPGAAGAGRNGGAAARGGPGGGNGLFGGDTGPFRLLNDALGGQAGWFIGFALVGGLAVLAATRLRRKDARTGWLVVVGGAFLTTAVAFSTASGIFHPYYVSALAPFTAMLVGGGVAQLRAPGTPTRILAPAAVLAGVACELVILGRDGASWAGFRPVIVVVGVLAAVALVVLRTEKGRGTALALAVAVLLVAPAAWSVQTLGHATNGTFPAGGPATAGFGGGPGGGPGGTRRAGAARTGAANGGGAGFPGAAGGTPPAGVPGGGGPGGFPGAGGTGAAGGATARGGFGGGGMFGGDTQSLTAALAYVRVHGGGTIAVSSQEGAAQAVIAGSSVAGIGGFSGSESETNPKWLASEIREGSVRWVLTGGRGGGGGRDGRVGASKVEAAVAKVCAAAPASALGSASTSSSTTRSFPGFGGGRGTSSTTATRLYDCGSSAAALARL